MKKYLIALMVAATAASFIANDAEAKRMGGGGSFGRQSQNVTRQAPPAQRQALPPSQQAAPAPAAPATPAPRPASPWKGILGGALLGLGLGALLSHFGLGGALASVISTILTFALLALVAMFIYRLFTRRKFGDTHQPAYASGYSARSSAPEIGSRVEPYSRQLQDVSASSAAPANAGSWEIPADFDEAGFLRNAKTYFIRLQAAWDRADINDIREFTTAEMFAELKMQIGERGPNPNHTDVVSLDADLLGIEKNDRDYMASVKFSGMIKESEHAAAEPFAEVWNLVKPISGPGGWVLAGIQQLS
jgi:predicted lipid-binding transport protein (Tim44 family)